MIQNPILNPAAIDALRSLCPPGDFSFLREMVEIYLADTPKQFEKLGNALAGGDAASVVRAAHTIKGSSGNFGAARLVAVALAIEADAKAGDVAAAAARFDELKQEYARVSDELGRLSR